MEKILGRSLSRNEEVHHVNKDFTDNRPENFQILIKEDHLREHRRIGELFTFTCPICGKEAVKSAAKVRHNRKQGKSGPYCSKRCAGKNHH